MGVKLLRPQLLDVPADVLGQGFRTSCFDISVRRATQLMHLFLCCTVCFSFFFHSSGLLYLPFFLCAEWQRLLLLPLLHLSLFSLHSFISVAMAWWRACWPFSSRPSTQKDDHEEWERPCMSRREESGFSPLTPSIGPKAHGSMTSKQPSSVAPSRSDPHYSSPANARTLYELPSSPYHTPRGRLAVSRSSSRGSATTFTTHKSRSRRKLTRSSSRDSQATTQSRQPSRRPAIGAPSDFRKVSGMRELAHAEGLRGIGTKDELDKPSATLSEPFRPLQLSIHEPGRTLSPLPTFSQRISYLNHPTRSSSLPKDVSIRHRRSLSAPISISVVASDNTHQRRIPISKFSPEFSRREIELPRRLAEKRLKSGAASVTGSGTDSEDDIPVINRTARSHSLYAHAGPLLLASTLGPVRPPVPLKIRSTLPSQPTTPTLRSSHYTSSTPPPPIPTAYSTPSTAATASIFTRSPGPGHPTSPATFNSSSPRHFSLSPRSQTNTVLSPNHLETERWVLAHNNAPITVSRPSSPVYPATTSSGPSPSTPVYPGLNLNLEPPTPELTSLPYSRRPLPEVPNITTGTTNTTTTSSLRPRTPSLDLSSQRSSVITTTTSCAESCDEDELPKGGTGIVRAQSTDFEILMPTPLLERPEMQQRAVTEPGTRGEKQMAETEKWGQGLGVEWGIAY